MINYGIKTGCNEAFIINTEKREEILNNCKTKDERKRTADIIRPILRGRDIKQYGYDWANLWLIATFPSRHYNIDEYPAIKKYLLSFAENILREAGYNWIADNKLAEFCKQKLAQTGREVLVDEQNIIINNKIEKARKKTNNAWFETQDSINYWEDFSKPKIMYPNMTQYLPFYYDKKCFLQNDKSFMISGRGIAFLCAFLNSSLFKYCFSESFPKLGDKGREVRKIFMDKIPIIVPNDEMECQFEKLVEDIQKEFTVEKAKNIDSILFNIYNLTEEEKNAIGYVEIQ